MADWSLVYQGIAAGAASVQAVMAMLQQAKNREITVSKESIFRADRQARESILNNGKIIKEAAHQIRKMDERTERVLNGKIKEADEKWETDMSRSNDPADWAYATDVRRQSICAILRVIRDKEGGILPGHWYIVWVKNNC